MKILIIESHNYSKKAISIYKKIGKIYLLKDFKRSKINSYKNKFKDIDILVVRDRVLVDKKMIELMPKLKVVASPTTGLNHIDTDFLKKNRIKLISLRGRKKFLKNITSTSEHAMALLLSLIRHIPWSFNDVKNSEWPRDIYIGNQLKDKTLGILGYGRLGKIFKKYAKAFGMNIIASDPHVSKKQMAKDGVKKVSMNDLFKKSDIISLHVLLTQDTFDLVKNDHLKLMKNNSFLINTSRGEIIEEGALYKALSNKWLRGAAIDVMRDERNDGSHLKNNDLVKYAKGHDNLIITSHLGGVSYEAMEETENFVADLVKSYIIKKRIKK